MSKIQDKFTELGDEGGFISFIVAGDPTPARTVDIARTIIDAGADILELGVPFSDPIADGPTIQQADERALKAGTNPDAVFHIVREIRKFSDIPLVFLTYYNIVQKRGMQKFYKKAADSGVDGILIVDMPIEESEEALKTAKTYDIDQIFLVAPTTSDARLKRILEHASGFIYLVSLLGVTGAREKILDTTLELIKRVRAKTELPIAVGFGISAPEHVKAVIEAGADAAIVGSAIVNIIQKNLDDGERMMEEMREYVKRMKRAAN